MAVCPAGELSNGFVMDLFVSSFQVPGGGAHQAQRPQQEEAQSHLVLLIWGMIQDCDFYLKIYIFHSDIIKVLYFYNVT